MAKSIQICKLPIKFGQASGTGTAMPILMKQIGMYLTYGTELYMEFQDSGMLHSNVSKKK